MIDRNAGLTTARAAALLLPLVLGACGPDLQGREGPKGDGPQSSEAAAAEVEARRVWSGDVSSYVAAPSPDGRYVTDVDWATGNLAVIDLESGEKRAVTDKVSWDDSDSYAEHSVFSPDGKRIAYTWFEQDVDGYQVRTISPEGEDVRVIFPANPSVAYPTVEDWSPDGRRVLLTVFRKDRTSDIGFVDLESGRYVKLETHDWRAPAFAAFSPGGEFVAYDFPAGEGFRQRDIFALSVDGSVKRTLVRGPGHDRLLGWRPDGGAILFHRQTERSRDFWSLPVRDGLPAGEAELVKRDVWRVTPYGFSRDAYYYGVGTESRRVHTVRVDLDAGRVLGRPEAVGDPSDGGSNYGTWSPDGSKLAYLQDVAGFRHDFLVVESAEGETLREIPVFLTQARRLRWTERGFIVYGTDAEGREGVYRMDPVTGELESQVTVTPGEARGLGMYEIARDGRTLYYDPVAADGTHSLVVWDLLTGERRTLRDDIRRAYGVSPDGSQMLFSHGDPGDIRIAVIPTDGSGPARTVYRFEKGQRTWGNQVAVPWTPDGRHFLLTLFPIEDEDAPRGIYRIPVEDPDGTPELLTTVPPSGGGQLQISPDGRWLSFSSGEMRNEIWRLTGLEGLPQASH